MGQVARFSEEKVSRLLARVGTEVGTRVEDR